jgi:hypothetical protein
MQFINSVGVFLVCVHSYAPSDMTFKAMDRGFKVSRTYRHIDAADDVVYSTDKSKVILHRCSILFQKLATRYVSMHR